MQEVIERHSLHSEINKPNPSKQLQLESTNYDKLHKKVVDKTLELRQLKGEDLQGLGIQQLQKLEEMVERGSTRVLKEKDERIAKDISTLKRKGFQLREENRQLKQRLENQQRQVSESLIICSSSDTPQDHNSSDAPLKLGLSLFM
ncbi:hypothetical protein L6164_036391 [Bauhinia variegata]|uniref:Uncharacterized protein n=1 Tax=Bauhinia variegata TaxID=167791 RepID=A0ACB9KH06_BAUVA|nr:hypothetical protein L6164_036391 [Bauhinia variegata]